MLNWLTTKFKNTSDDISHPLGNDAAIDAWLAELPANLPQRVLPAMDEWLSDPEHLAQHLDPQQMLRAVSHLDEFAQVSLESCWQELWQEAAKEKRTSLPVRPLENYYHHSYTSNLFVFNMLAANQKLAEDKRNLTRFALRAMHALVQQKKLARMTYRAPDADWWQQAHSLLRNARAIGISHLLQPTYRRTDSQSSPWKEYMAGLLLETAPLDNLSANEIEAADRLCRWVEPRSQYVATPSTLTFFQIEADGKHEPARQAADAVADPRFRYLGPGAGYSQLIQLRASIVSEGKIPPWLESSTLGKDALKNLLHTLIVHWSPNPPTRSQPRLTAGGRIQVVNGLPLARRMVAASEFARSGRSLDYEGHIKALQMRHKGHAVVADIPPPPKTPMEVLHLLETAGDRQMMDHWEIIDASEKGMGVRCFNRRPWQTIGALIAWRRDETLDWQIGIIRRLGASHGKPNAGLSVFPGTPQVSQVRISNYEQGDNLWSQQTQETSGLGWRDAILVSAETKLILVPPGTFKTDHRIDISIGGRFRPARLAGLQAKGADYELVLYRDADETPPA